MKKARQATSGQPVIVERGAVVALRESAVITLAKVGSLNSRQVEAAFHFNNIFQNASGEAGRLFREYVDGSQAHLVAERHAEAMQELRRCRALLGQHGYRLIVSIVGEGAGLGDLYSTRRQRDTAADLLRLHLDELADLWGDSREWRER